MARYAHGLVAAVVAVALLVQIGLLLGGGADASSGASDPDLGVGIRLVRFFSYFTVQSNLFVLVASATLAVRPDRDGRVWRVVRLDSLLAIAVTGIVYAVLLAPLVHPTGVALGVNVALHVVSPIATVLVWLVFGPRPRITWQTVGWAFVWPVAWLAYTFVSGALTGWYPYPFLDTSVLGYPRAVAATGGVLVLGLVFALAFARLDRLRTWGRATNS